MIQSLDVWLHDDPPPIPYSIMISSRYTAPFELVYVIAKYLSVVFMSSFVPSADTAIVPRDVPPVAAPLFFVKGAV